METLNPTILSSASMGAGIADGAIPEDVIPPKMRALLYAFQQKTSAPIPTIFSCVLATLAVVHGGSVDIESWKGGIFPLNFFALVASGTGEGKSRVINEIMNPLFNYDSDIEKQQETNKNAYHARLKYWRKKLKIIEKNMEDEIKSGSIHVDNIEAILRIHLGEKPIDSNHSKKIISDVTLSGLRDALIEADGDSMLLVNPDAARMFKETLLKFGPDFCSAWSGEPFNIIKHRIKVSAENPRLSMLLMVQPSMIDGFFDEDHEFRTSGLAARFITYFPESIIGQKWRINSMTNEYYQSAIDEWKTSIANLLNTNRLRHISCGNAENDLMILSEESVRFLTSSYYNIDRYLAGDNNEFTEVNDIIHRLLEQSCRVATLYELFDDPESREIKPHHVEMAFNLMLAHARYFRRICNPDKPKISTITKAQKILTFLRSAQKYQQPIYDPYGNFIFAIPMETYQRVGPVRKKVEYDEAFRLLEISNIIRVDSAIIFNGTRNINKKMIYLLNLQAAIAVQG